MCTHTHKNKYKIYTSALNLNTQTRKCKGENHKTLHLGKIEDHEQNISNQKGVSYQWGRWRQQSWASEFSGTLFSFCSPFTKCNVKIGIFKHACCQQITMYKFILKRLLEQMFHCFKGGNEECGHNLQEFGDVISKWWRKFPVQL